MQRIDNADFHDRVTALVATEPGSPERARHIEEVIDVLVSTGCIAMWVTKLGGRDGRDSIVGRQDVSQVMLLAIVTLLTEKTPDDSARIADWLGFLHRAAVARARDHLHENSSAFTHVRNHARRRAVVVAIQSRLASQLGREPSRQEILDEARHTGQPLAEKDLSSPQASLISTFATEEEYVATTEAVEDMDRRTEAALAMRRVRDALAYAGHDDTATSAVLTAWEALVRDGERPTAPKLAVEAGIDVRAARKAMAALAEAMAEVRDWAGEGLGRA